MCEPILNSLRLAALDHSNTCSLMVKCPLHLKSFDLLEETCWAEHTVELINVSFCHQFPLRFLASFDISSLKDPEEFKD